MKHSILLLSTLATVLSTSCHEPDVTTPVVDHPEDQGPVGQSDGGTYIPDAGTPAILEVQAVRTYSNGPRSDATCPNNTVLIGGGCSCNDTAASQPTLRATLPASLPGNPPNTYVCACEVLRDADGRLFSTGANAVAYCVNKTALKYGDYSFQKDICWDPYFSCQK